MICGLAALPSAAFGQTATKCGVNDAPAPWNGIAYSCPWYQMCGIVGTTLTCDLRAFCSGEGGMMWMVESYGGFGDLSVFGNCYSGAGFCCTWAEETGTVDTVAMEGTDYPDEWLSFSWNPGGNDEKNLHPWDADEIEAFVRGHGADDWVMGSNYDGADYIEYLYGQAGDDVLLGLDDRDFLSGGAGDDLLDGGDSSDRLLGGDGDDELVGGNGGDYLCDSTGAVTCATSGGNVFYGGGNDDVMWYAETALCPNLPVAMASTGDGGSDTCGDANAWGVAELPLSCESPTLTVEPAQCTDPT